MDEMTDAYSTSQRVEHQAIERSFRELLQTEAGRRAIYWLLEQSAIYQDAYTGEAASTNYVLGQQSTGRKLIAKLDEIDAQFYPQLLIDMAEIRSRDRAAAEAIDNPEQDDD